VTNPREQYTPTEFSTSTSKEKFEKQFKKFVTGGYKFRDFPKWFYTRLSTCFGHIACYDQHQFYAVFFITPEDRRRFNNMTLSWPCHGDPASTYSDVEKVLQAWMQKLVDDYDSQVLT